MMLQTRPVIEKASDHNQRPADDHPERRESKALEEMRSILADAVFDVTALLDAVCCRCGEWVDWRHYRPLPGVSSDRGDPGSIVRLALADDIFGLHAGGYIEVCVVREEGGVEACGGYYDSYDQPQPVIEGSLRWHEVNHQNVRQLLMMMRDRIFRAYLLREEPDARLPLAQRVSVQGERQLEKQPAGSPQKQIRERM